jgi:hypothetical protein
MSDLARQHPDEKGLLLELLAQVPGGPVGQSDTGTI